jgi:hypothetical protein
MRRQSVPAPELLTTGDVLRLILAALMIPLGIIILTRTFSLAPTIPGALVGCAFIAFGSYRLWLGYSRYRLYRRKMRESRE